MITDEMLDYVAALSRLQIAPETRAALRDDLAGIIAHMNLLNEVDTSQTEAMSHVLQMTNVTREDRVAPSFEQNALLANAPKQDGTGFLVPKTVE